MTCICSDCGKSFVMELRLILFIQDALKTNLSLKVICTSRGMKLQLALESKNNAWL